MVWRARVAPWYRQVWGSQSGRSWGSTHSKLHIVGCYVVPLHSVDMRTCVPFQPVNGTMCMSVVPHLGVVFFVAKRGGCHFAPQKRSILPLTWGAIWIAVGGKKERFGGQNGLGGGARSILPPAGSILTPKGHPVGGQFGGSLLPQD